MPTQPSMNAARRVRAGLVSHRVIATIVFGAAAALPQDGARAQTAPTVLPTISIEGTQNQYQQYKVDAPSSPKMTEPLLDTPATINVVPRKVIEDQGATSLREALRNVPGVSALAGEGGGPQGDNIRIRGFTANNDIYIDGMRDISQYNRDAFNLEGVEVIKGASGTFTGRGATGGLINLVTKTPQATSFVGGALSAGTEQTFRGTADINQSLASYGWDGAALRLNLMGHTNEVAERNVVESNRFGFAPSLAFGLGKPTRVNLSYVHFQEDNIADYGLPTLAGVPLPLNRRNFYGFKDLNTEETTSDVGTFLVEHDLNDYVTLRNQFRYSDNSRYSIVTPPRNPSLTANTVTRNPTGRDIHSTLAINQTDATVKFTTGGIGHTIVTGLELSRENFDNQPLTFAGAAIDNLRNPNPNATFTGTRTNGIKTETQADTVALYVFDTVKLTDQWQLVGGLRWDRFDAETKTLSTGVAVGRVDEEPSWRTGIVYKPIKNASLYVAYGSSFNPSAEALAITPVTANLDPEKNRSYELGGKLDLLNNKLALNAAIFRIEKTNARTTDATLGVTVLEGEQRADGFEIGVTGNLTDKWQIFGGYTYVTTEILRSRVPAEVGKELQGVPNHAVSLWTTFELPYNFQIGGGMQFASERKTNNTNTGEVDSYVLFDALVAYHLTPNVDVKLNLYNLTNENYIERIHSGGGHIVPGAGRTALVTTSFKF